MGEQVWQKGSVMIKKINLGFTFNLNEEHDMVRMFNGLSKKEQEDLLKACLRASLSQIGAIDSINEGSSWAEVSFSPAIRPIGKVRV